MPNVTVTAIAAPHTAPAKRGTQAVKEGETVYAIEWHDSPFGKLRFCWLYLDEAFAREVADKVDITHGSIEANWRAVGSRRFYYTGRTRF